MMISRSAFLVATLPPMLVLFGTVPIQAQNRPTTEPTVLSVVPAGYGGLLVTWTAVTDATGYEVRYEAESDPLVGTIEGETDVIEDVGNVRTHLVTGLEHDSRYLVAVRGYNTAGKGPWAAPLDGATIPVSPPAQVEGLVLTAGDGSITASWDATNGQGLDVTYRVEISRGHGRWSAHYEVDTGTEHAFSGLINGAEHSVRVAAMTSGGVGAWSEAAMATPTADGGTDGEDLEETPALPVLGAVALGAGLLAAGRARLRRRRIDG